MKSKIFLASVLSAFAVAASAQSVIGPVDLDPSLVNQSAEFKIPAKSVLGSFVDTITFAFTSLPSDPSFHSWAVGTAVHIQFLTTPNVDFTSVTLNGVLGKVTNSVIDGRDVSEFFVGPVEYSPLNLPAYTLIIEGSAIAGGAYGGSLNVAVVPEPETYLMMLAGLGAIGFLVARRRNRA